MRSIIDRFSVYSYIYIGISYRNMRIQRKITLHCMAGGSDSMRHGPISASESYSEQIDKMQICFMSAHYTHIYIVAGGG